MRTGYGQGPWPSLTVLPENCRNLSRLVMTCQALSSTGAPSMPVNHNHIQTLECLREAAAVPSSHPDQLLLCFLKRLPDPGQQLVIASIATFEHPDYEVISSR